MRSARHGELRCAGRRKERTKKSPPCRRERDKGGQSSLFITPLKPKAGLSGPPDCDYSRTKIFFFEQISFKIFGHTATLTSPRCAFRNNSINVRDWPMPPPIESGMSLFKIA